jgi:hypothetical protein
MEAETECSNFRILSLGQFARRSEIDCEAIPTWQSLFRGTLGSINERCVLVPAAVMHKRISPCALEMSVQWREPQAKRCQDFNDYRAR